MQEIEKRALKFQESLGLRQFYPPEISQMSQHFAGEMLEKLKNPDAKTSLKMIDTHLRPVTMEQLQAHEGERALILEIGGTNVFAARGVIRDGQPRIEGDSHGAPVQARGELSKRKFDHPDEFFAEVFRHIDSVIRYAPVENVGIIYTFPASTVDTALGIDVVSPVDLPKNFRIEGIDRQPVGTALVDFMGNRGYDVSELGSLVVLNDTPAALLSVPGAKIGGIVGTGYNLAIMVGGRIYNLECGGFASVPQCLLSRAVDERSDNPGLQLAEKQISGMYLGMAMEEAMSELGSWGFRLDKRYGGFLDGKVVSDILKGDLAGVSAHVGGDVNEQMMAMLRPVAETLRWRSTQLVGMKLATIINTFPTEFPQRDVVVPIEGSVFWQMPDYRERVQGKAAEHTGKRFIFPAIDHAGALGAIVAVIGFRR